jgi:predicted PurR-regulated permease PerM
MLLDYIEHARSQPKEVRRRIVWTWSLALTGVIVLLWLSVLIGRQYAEQGGSMKEESPTPKEEITDMITRFNAANDFLRTEPAVFTLPSQTSTSTASTTNATSTGDASSTVPMWP